MNIYVSRASDQRIARVMKPLTWIWFLLYTVTRQNYTFLQHSFHFSFCLPRQG